MILGKGSYYMLAFVFINITKSNQCRHATTLSLTFQGELGLKVAQMIVELVRDNRKIVDRISKAQFQQFIELLGRHKV